MNIQETEKFKRVGSYFILLVLGIGIGAPVVLALLAVIVDMINGHPFNALAAFSIALASAFFIWIILLMLIAWGNFTQRTVKRTAKKVDELPFQFSTFTGRAGMLLIDVEKGMVGFISAYNPKEIQLFNASRIDRPKTIASMMTGVRFVFYLDGKKITMYTLLTNRMVNLKSGIGAEAVSKADAFVELLQAAKNNARTGAAR